MMIMKYFCAVVILSLGSVVAFQVPLACSSSMRAGKGQTIMSSSPNSNLDMERMKAFVEAEALNEQSLKASAEAMKNLKPGDIDQILKEMENMPPSQLEQLKSMGMDPSIMKSSLEMMKQNPEVMRSVGEMMETMTPEELLKQSRQAQEAMKLMSDSTSPATETKISNVKDDDMDDDDEEGEEEDGEPIEPDEKVMDVMFQAAEFMSEPPKGGVTFAGFCTVPPIAVLAAGNGEDDLSKKELSECWNKGSLGATRVDKAGFKRVWMEVQDNYYSDIMEEARERTLVRAKKTKRGVSKEKSTTPPVPTYSAPPAVGTELSPEKLGEAMKNMKDEDVEKMFEQMSNMSPAEEARLRAMGVDPGMMKKSAQMMKNNAFLRKGFTAMMKNAKPEDILRSSQMTQEKMANMSEEEKKRFLENLK